MPPTSCARNLLQALACGQERLYGLWLWASGIAEYWLQDRHVSLLVEVPVVIPAWQVEVFSQSPRSATCTKAPLGDFQDYGVRVRQKLSMPTHHKVAYAAARKPHRVDGAAWLGLVPWDFLVLQPELLVRLQTPIRAD